MIDSYLSQKADLDDRAIHLLFSANRWERACVPTLSSPAPLFQERAPADTAPRQVPDSGGPAKRRNSRLRSLRFLWNRFLCHQGVLQCPVSHATMKRSADRIGEQGLSWNWCRAPDVGLPQPDLVLFLRVSPEVAQQRGGFGQERYETSEVQAKVEKAFTKLGQSVGKDVWTEIDADKGVDEVHEEIVRRVEQALGSEALDGEVKKLWEDALGDEKD